MLIGTIIFFDTIIFAHNFYIASEQHIFGKCCYSLLLLGRIVYGVVRDSLGVCCGLFDGGAPAQRRLEDEVSRVEEETVHVSS